MNHPAPQIVVTGIGAVTPLGPDVASTWQRLVAGHDAQSAITLFPVNGCRCQRGAQAILPPLTAADERRFRRWPHATRLAASAFGEALAMAGLLDAAGRSRLPWVTLTVSTTSAAMGLGEHFLRGLLAGRRGPGRVYDAAHYQSHQQILDLQDHFGFRGPMTIIANACASGANAIGYAAELIRAGDTELVVAGGYEPLTELIYVGFDCLQSLSLDKCRPFDTARSGLMLGEAAGFLVLETEAAARARGAAILGVLAGYGHATDLHHLTQPHPRGVALVSAMRQALTAAQLPPAAIGYLNAHGTATPLNDASECAAFSEIFGGDGAQLRLSSTKAAIGHTLGAAGAVEAIFTLQALRTGVLPPNLNVRQPEPAVAAWLVTNSECRPDLRAAMSVNLGFGGSNAALIFTKNVTNSQKIGDVVRISTKFDAPIAIAGVGTIMPADEPRPTPSLTGREWPVRRLAADHPALQRWQNEPRLRRASRLPAFMLAAADQALAAAGDVNRATLGIVAALHAGALVMTSKFFRGVIESGQRFASPNFFPETVFNSPTSHVAAVLGVTGPAYTVVGDDSAWVTALNIATKWLADGLVAHALVIAAEEFDPMTLDAYATVRWLRRGGAFIPAEGAGAVVLRRARATDAVRLVATAEGFTHRNKAQARAAAANLFAQFPDTPAVWPTAAGSVWAALEAEWRTRRAFVAPPAGLDCSGAFGASAAWYTAAATAWVRATGGELLVPVWGHSQQCSALRLAALSGK